MTKWTDIKLSLLPIIRIAASTSLVVTLATLSIAGHLKGDAVTPLTSLDFLSSISKAGQRVVECGKQTYSPVQNICVDQHIFEQEMRLLFSALGINTKIYDRSNQN